MAPVTALYFTLFVTGVPASEKAARATYGEEYHAYQRMTSMLVPLPKRWKEISDRKLYECQLPEKAVSMRLLQGGGQGGGEGGWDLVAAIAPAYDRMFAESKVFAATARFAADPDDGGRVIYDYEYSKYAGAPTSTISYVCTPYSGDYGLGHMTVEMELPGRPRPMGLALTAPSFAWQDMWVVAVADDGKSWLVLGDGDHRTRCMVLTPRSGVTLAAASERGEADAEAVLKQVAPILKAKGYACEDLVQIPGRH